MTGFESEYPPIVNMDACVIVQEWSFREKLWPMRRGVAISVHKRYADYQQYMRKMNEHPEARQVKGLDGGLMQVAGSPWWPKPPMTAVVSRSAAPSVIETNHDGTLLDMEHDTEITLQIYPITTFN